MGGGVQSKGPVGKLEFGVEVWISYVGWSGRDPRRQEEKGVGCCRRWLQKQPGSLGKKVQHLDLMRVVPYPNHFHARNTNRTNKNMLQKLKI